MSTAGEIMAVNADLMQIATTIKNEWKRASEKQQFGNLWLSCPTAINVRRENTTFFTFDRKICRILPYFFMIRHIFKKIMVLQIFFY